MTCWAGIILFVAVTSATPSTYSPAVPAIPPETTAFPMKDVHLLGGPLKHSQDIAAHYLLSLEPDRLLARFRQEAGLPKKAENYPGWETVQLPGVGLGFYLSGSARLYATTGDTQFLERINYIIDELDACQKANGNGFLLATKNGKKIFSDIESGQINLGGGWFLNGEPEPYYAMEKLFSGLRDAYRYAGNEKALTIEVRLGGWMEKHLSHLNEQQLDQIMTCEYGGINWVLSDLYADTGDARYLALSKRWHDKPIADPLARGEDCLPQKHANTQFPKICGMAARYPYTGDIRDRAAAEFFWDRVVNHHSYVTGGNSESEHFGPPDQLSTRLSTSDTELCNSYNMVRLTQLLFAIQPKPQYADYVERVLFNHILAAQHPDDARICYFTPLATGYPRVYQTLYDTFSCCTCSGFDSYAKHAEFIYSYGKDALFVNLFAASEVQWREKGVTLRQETQFPDEDHTTMVFTCAKPVAFALNVRCPSWCTEGVTFDLNGQPQQVTAHPGSYAVIKRTWQSGDLLRIQFPMTLRIESMPDNARKIAFFKGPILLAAPMQGTSLSPEIEPFAPMLIPGGKDLLTCLTPVQGSLFEYTLSQIVQPADMRLKPFYQIHGQPYAVYWDVLSQEEWNQKKAERVAIRQRFELQNKNTLDVVYIGDEASESAHQLKGEKSNTGAGAYMKHTNRRWRDAMKDGWFSYEMAIPKGTPATLLCTYWGREEGARTFDILVNGVVIATQTLNSQHPEDFYEVVYPVPAKLAKDLEKITVTFKAHPGNMAGGLFGLRSLKTPPK